MRLNTKNLGWAYSILRLLSQVRTGALSKVASGFPPKAAEGSLFVPAEGSSRKAAKSSLIASLDGSPGCSLRGFSLLPLKRKLSGSSNFILLAWLVVASQFSLPAHGEQTDDLAIHSQLDRLHENGLTTCTRCNPGVYLIFQCSGGLLEPLGLERGDGGLPHLHSLCGTHLSAAAVWTTPACRSCHSA